MKKIAVRFKKLHEDAVIPFYAYETDAGMDICSIEDVVLLPQEIKTISTGLAAEIISTEKAEIQVRSRSGLASSKGIFVLNSPGTIDMGYRGEIKVILANAGKEAVMLLKHSKIAQLVVTTLPSVQVEVCSKISATERGENGFGSSGI